MLYAVYSSLSFSGYPLVPCIRVLMIRTHETYEITKHNNRYTHHTYIFDMFKHSVQQQPQKNKYLRLHPQINIL